MGTKVLIIIISVAWLVFGYFIWPTPYYVEVHSVDEVPLVVKVNRFSGEIESMKMDFDSFIKMLEEMRR